MKVSFIGAGPGDPKLLTIKGKEIIEQSEIIIYAGSLVNKDILKYAVRAKEIIDSSTQTLENLGEIFRRGKERDCNIARIHSGDPAIYGAIIEQMELLDSMEISYEVVPGISCFQAAAAALKVELTLPEVCQTITLSRVEGRTPVPAKEKLEELVKTRPTLFLYLSIDKLKYIVEILKTSYPPDTPIAILYKVSWPEEKIITGALNNIVEKMDGMNITKSALILVGEVLKKKGKASCLYDKNFFHLCRPE